MSTLPSTFAAFAGVELGGHALGQWDARTPADSVAPETAFARSVPVHESIRPLFRTGYHPTPDDVLLYWDTSHEGTYGVVFIIQALPDDVCRTVYRFDSIRDPARRAYCWARVLDGMPTPGGGETT